MDCSLKCDLGEPGGVSPRTNLSAGNVRGLTPAGSPFFQARPPPQAAPCIQRQSVSQVPEARSREPSRPTFAPSPLKTAQSQPELAQKRDAPDDAHNVRIPDDRAFRDNSHRRHPRAVEHSKHHHHSRCDRTTKAEGGGQKAGSLWFSFRTLLAAAFRFLSTAY